MQKVTSSWFFLSTLKYKPFYISHVGFFILCLPVLSKVVKTLFLHRNRRDALISQIYFRNRTLHVSGSFSVQNQESSTVHTATCIGHTGYADCLLTSSQHNLYDL